MRKLEDNRLCTISNILSAPELKYSPDSDLFIVALGEKWNRPIVICFSQLLDLNIKIRRYKSALCQILAKLATLIIPMIYLIVDKRGYAIIRSVKPDIVKNSKPNKRVVSSVGTLGHHRYAPQ